VYCIALLPANREVYPVPVQAASSQVPPDVGEDHEEEIAKITFVRHPDAEPAYRGAAPVALHES
jgi:hypothetical protein